MSTPEGPSQDGQSGPTADAGLGAGPDLLEERAKRGLTIRLKLTLWYSVVFILCGVILIAANYYMVRNSLNIAPERARAAVAQKYHLDPGALEFGHFPVPDPGQPMDRYITVDGIPLPHR